MSTFVAERSPSDDSCDALAALEPRIPYYTRAYRDAVSACNREVWLLGEEGEDGLAHGCLGELFGGRLRRQLHIQSTPNDVSADFWSGLAALCKAENVTTLNLGTVGTAPTIAFDGRVMATKERTEFWVDLTVPELLMALRPQQRRVWRKAEKLGLAIRQPSLEAGLEGHRELTGFSLGRRRERGEEIPFFEQTLLPRAMIESGAARLFEVVDDDDLLGSVIFTVADAGAHGYSAGYSRAGMKAGAGVFLNMATFELMKAEGRQLFNLGDAPPDSGLATFKRGLGGQARESRSVRFDTAAAGRRLLIGLHAAVRSLRRGGPAT